MRMLRLILYIIVAILLSYLLAGLLSCTKKSNDIVEKKYQATLYSDKYTVDSVYLRTDTLWVGDNLTREDYDKVLAIPQSSWLSWVDCPDPIHPFRIEHRMYVLDGGKHTPLIFK